MILFDMMKHIVLQIKNFNRLCGCGKSVCMDTVRYISPITDHSASKGVSMNRQ